MKIFVGRVASGDLSAAEYDLSVSAMREIADLAHNAGLVISGETHAKTLFDGVESCLRFIEDVGVGNFKVCFQPYDLRDTDRAVADYECLAPHVIHVHYQGRRGQQYDLLENSELDYRRLTRTLVEHRFSGYVCLEFVKDCTVSDPVKFNIQRVLENASLDREFVRHIAAALGESAAA